MPPPAPVTTPVPVPTVATVVVLLVHLPPPVPSLRVLVCPTHSVVIPVMGSGLAFTEITVLVMQPAPRE